jgi:hypothetical protein
MRIDSSGNLLVGATSAYGTTGTTINAAGLVYSSASGDRAGQFDRTTSDGEIVRFSKAGTTVGSIGTRDTGALEIGSGDVYLQFNGANDWIKPVDGSGNNKSGVSLGTTGAKFNNLRLSGTAYVDTAVGIGTTSPDGKLDVAQAMTNGSTGAFTSPHLALTATNSTDTTGFVGMTMATSDTANYGFSYGALRSSGGLGDLIWKNHYNSAAGTELLRLTYNGNVGIGTSSPNAALDVLGTTSDQLRLRTAESEEYKIGRNASTGLLDFSGTQTNYTGYTFGGVDGERMRIDSSGNVGIGNSTPSNNHANANRLVVGNGTAGGIANYVGTGLGWYAFSRDNANNTDAYDGGMSYDGDRNLMFHTNAGSERMRIDGAGRLLVGATSNTSRGGNATKALIKLGTGESYFDIQASSTSANSDILFSDGSGGHYGIVGYQHSTDSMLFYTASTERMRIDSSGRLLVDTTSIGNASTNAKIVCDSEFLARGSSAGYFWENRSGMTIASQSGWGGWYSTGSSVHYLYSDGANRASIGRTSGTYTALSDVNKKKDFEDSTVGLAEVMQLKPKKFRMLEDADDAPKKLGFVAQDVENVIPEAYVEDLSDDENEETFIGLTDRPIIAALTKAIQEQQTIIDDLKSRIETLEG